MITEQYLMDTILQLAVILFASKAVGTAFKKMHHSRAIGEVAAGILLGATFLNFIDLNSQILFFLAEIGVIAHVFETGIESNLHELMRNRKSAIFTGALSALLPLAGAILVLGALGIETTQAFFIGAALSVTSIDFSISILRENRKLTSPEGTTILGAAIINNILAIVMLAGIGDVLSQGRIIPGHIAQILMLAFLFFAGTIYLGKRYQKQADAMVKALKKERLFFVGAFVLAISMAYLAESLGLTAIMGAFAAGLLLEREEHKEHVSSRTRSITRLFTPVFFVLAGAQANFLEILGENSILLLAAITFTGFATKMASGIGAGKEKASKHIVGAGMLPMGELGFIFASFGFVNGIINAETYAALTGAVIILTGITPFMLKRCRKNSIPFLEC